eukprot:3932586-Rhodomonas_salina.4
MTREKAPERARARARGRRRSCGERETGCLPGCVLSSLTLQLSSLTLHPAALRLQPHAATLSAAFRPRRLRRARVRLCGVGVESLHSVPRPCAVLTEGVGVEGVAAARRGASAGEPPGTIPVVLRPRYPLLRYSHSTSSPYQALDEAHASIKDKVPYPIRLRPRYPVRLRPRYPVRLRPRYPTSPRPDALSVYAPDTLPPYRGYLPPYIAQYSAVRSTVAYYPIGLRAG